MSNVIVEQNVPAKMRDGVTLRADVFRPEEKGRFPVLLTRLPYGKDLSIGKLFERIHVLRAVREGYVVIVQDCRGSWDSEGDFEYCFHEGKDGYDTVEWAADLPYASGAVGMFGLSHFGWTQWSAAGLHPPHLRAIAPMQTWSDFSAMRFRGGAFELADALTWRTRMSIGKLTRELAAQGRPVEEANAVMRDVMTYLDRLTEGGHAEVPLRHIKSLEKLGLAGIIGELLDLGPGNQKPGYRVDYAGVEVPSLNIAGWYDVFLQYTLDNFINVRKYGKGAARQAQLLVGPWAHGKTEDSPGMMVGEMNFGAAASGAMIDFKDDLTAVHLRWFDHWLKGIDNGVEKEAPVKLFLTGENRWIEMPDWPPEAQEKRIYLGDGGTLDFSLTKSKTGATSYTYDPADPAPTLGGPLPPFIGVKDQRPLSERPDVLTFSGTPLKQRLEVAGRIIADLWVSSAAPDTDFVARLIDVYPDGYMQNLCDGIMRARYRNSLKEVTWIQPGDVFELKVDLWSVAHVFKPGHRLAVQVTSSSFPRWDRNWNTKEDPGAATKGQAARQTIWHNSQHPSSVILPVIAK